MMRLGGCAGTSLLETVVVLSLMSVGLLCLAPLLMVSSTVKQQAIVRTEVRQLLLRTLEEIQGRVAGEPEVRRPAQALFDRFLPEANAGSGSERTQSRGRTTTSPRGKLPRKDRQK